MNSSIRFSASGFACAALLTVGCPASGDPPESRSSRELRGFVVDADTGVSVERPEVKVRFLKEPRQEEDAPGVIDEPVGRRDGMFIVDASEAWRKGCTTVVVSCSAPGYVAESRRMAIPVALLREDLRKGWGLGPVQLSPGRRIIGKLVGSAGRPAAGVRLSCTSVRDLRDEMLRTDFTAVTDAQGGFDIVVHKSGFGNVWCRSPGYAPLQLKFDAGSGDLGLHQLPTGVSITGAVRSMRRDVFVNAAPSAEGARFPYDLVGGGRSIQVGGGGRFALGPFAPGKYEIDVGRRMYAEGGGYEKAFLSGYMDAEPESFARVWCTVGSTTEHTPIRFEPIPTVAIRGRVVDSKGNAFVGPLIMVGGEFNGKEWGGYGRPAADGSFNIRAPKSLSHLRMHVDCDESHAASIEHPMNTAKRDEDWFRSNATLSADVEGFRVVVHRSPELIVRVRAPRQEVEGGPYLEGDTTDGGRLRERQLGAAELSESGEWEYLFYSVRMLPGRRYRFSARAKGLVSDPLEVELAEGERRTVSLALRPAR